MAVTQREIGTISDLSSTADTSSIDLIRRRMMEMSDGELLRFGVTAKYKCLLERRSKHPRLQSLVMELDEARAEWIRRHPALPLRISF